MGIMDSIDLHRKSKKSQKNWEKLQQQSLIGQKYFVMTNPKKIKQIEITAVRDRDGYLEIEAKETWLKGG